MAEASPATAYRPGVILDLAGNDSDVADTNPADTNPADGTLAVPVTPSLFLFLRPPAPVIAVHFLFWIENASAGFADRA
jgi:hypothetical protein